MTTPLIPSRRGKPGDDPIFALNAEANARRARGESVVNATLGALMDDAGALAILPAAAQAMRDVPPAEWAAYAPISGPRDFLEAVANDVFAKAAPARLRELASCATPGGTGALRHAIALCLEPGQSLLCSSFFWGPYATLAEETGRSLATFRMFDAAGALDAGDLDRAMGGLVRAQGRVLLIVNDPCHNPTGYAMSAADWDAVVAVVLRHAASAPVAVLLDAPYAAYGPAGATDLAMAALERIAAGATVLHAWSASKAFTHYGLRVGALLAVVPDSTERADMAAAMAFACRGTWSNCNRGGIWAITRLLVEPARAAAVARERAGLRELLAARVRTFNARAGGRLAYPRYEGGFFVTVFTPQPEAACAQMRADGCYAVPVDGGIRVGICAVRESDVPRLTDALVAAL